MKTIIFTAQKGGCGKSSSAVVIAYALTADKKKVAFIDLDNQQNSSDILLPGTRTGYTVKEVLQGKCKPAQALLACDAGALMPASAFLSDLDIKSLQAVKTILDTLRGSFDYCIVDLPPNLGAIVLSAMAAADFAVVPAKADSLGAQTTKNTLDSIKTIQERGNRGLQAGILPVMYNNRATLNKTYLEALQAIGQAYGARIFAPIRSSISVSESQAVHRNLFTYAPKSGAAIDYKIFYNELRRTIENG